MDLLSLREHHARTLLIHYRWDVDKIIAVLIDKGKDQLYEEAGVTTVAINDFSSQLPSTLTCNVCMEEVSVCEVTIMDCGHYFCNNCKFYGCLNNVIKITIHFTQVYKKGDLSLGNIG